VAGIALAAFIVIEVRGKTPLLQLKFFRDWTFSGANLVGVIVSFGFFSVVFFLSLFMQNVQGYSPTEAGALQLPSTLGVMTAAIVSGRIVGRIGSRLPITVGLVMAGAALLCLTGVQPDTPYSAFWYWLLLMGLGIGLIMSPMTSAIMGTVPPARAGMASATSNTMRQVGSVFGIAVLGNVVTHVFKDDLRTSLAAFKLPPAVAAKILAVAGQGREAVSGKAIPGVDMAALGRAMGQSFTNGVHTAMWISGFLLIAGAPIAYLTVRYTAPHHVDQRHAAAAAAAEASPASDLEAAGDVG
jgi:MFS family permease